MNLGPLGCLVIGLIFTTVACSKKPDPPKERVPDISRELVPQAAQPVSILDKTFDLKTSAAFPFEIPARSTQPHLHGIFESHLGNARGASNDAANIGLVVMNEQQQEDFANNRATETLFSIEDSHSQSVNFDLPPSFGQPVKYYLIFQNSRDGKTGKVIKANFRVDF